MEHPLTSNAKAIAKKRPRPFDSNIFQEVNAVTLKSLENLCHGWLPDGRKKGAEFVALNPTRADRHPGSFMINLTTGRWADFATGDKGGDPISFYAYINGLTQIQAARELAKALGVAS